MGDILGTVTLKLAANIIVIIAVALYFVFQRRVRRFWRQNFGVFPLKLKTNHSLQMDMLLDAIRFAGTKVKDWNPNAAIIGLNRGGAIMVGLLSKFLDHNRIGLVDFSIKNRPRLCLPSYLSDEDRKPKSVVLIDDRFHTGSTAARGIKLLRSELGKDVEIFYIALIANTENIRGHASGVGSEPLSGTARDLVLFLPSTPEKKGAYMLPWDTNEFRSSFKINDL